MHRSTGSRRVGAADTSTPRTTSAVRRQQARIFLSISEPETRARFRVRVLISLSQPSPDILQLAIAQELQGCLRSVVTA